MQRLLSKPVPDWATFDYLIMDSTGKILHKNFTFDQTIDENGIIHLSSPEHSLDTLVYVADRKKYKYKIHFCHGKNLDHLNNYTADLIDKGYIKTPKNFKKGFTKTDEHPLENQPY